MLPVTFPADSQIPSVVPIVFRVRLNLSSIDDLHCPSTLHGFHGTVSLSSPWQFSAQCITKVYANGTFISEEAGNLQLVTSLSPSVDGSQVVQAFLPESPLSRSRWLDESLQTTISQQIVVDSTTLGFIVYDLDRKNTTGAPSAHLQSDQRHRPQNPIIIAPPPPPLPFPFPLPSPSPSPAPLSLFSMGYEQASHSLFLPRLIRCPEPTSLSCALIPNHPLTSFNTSMLF
jgi:hypothetical protein